MSDFRRRAVGLALTLALSLVGLPAAGQIAIDRAIVELTAGGPGRADVEVRNTSDETAYVAIEAAEVRAPGMPDERRVTATDPEVIGLLVTPTRLVLEPGARRVVRLVTLDDTLATDRVWRVGIRPVSGPTTSETTALQVLVGYGVLVFARPPSPRIELSGERIGRTLHLSNQGNTNALLFDGEQCDSSGTRCQSLPVRRLYSNNRWTVDLPYTTPAVFQVLGPEGQQERSF